MRAMRDIRRSLDSSSPKASADADREGGGIAAEASQPDHQRRIARRIEREQ